MTSTTGISKKTPIVVTSTANSGSLSAYKATDSANASPTASLLLRAAAGPGLGRSRDQRPSSPVSSTLAAPPPYTRHCAHLRDSIDNFLKREIICIFFQDVERGLQEAKAEVVTYTTKLADSKHRQHHDMLFRKATTITASVHDTEATIITLEQDIREGRSRLGVLQLQERSAAAAVEASSRTHQSFTAGFRTHPWTHHPGAVPPAKMTPPPPRPPQASDTAQSGQQHAPVDTRLRQDPPGGRSEPPDTWAGVTSRRPQPLPRLPNDDSYLDVRVSSLRHHNYGFPLSTRNSIFDLASATYATLKDVGRSKASLRFALDLALKTPSPLSRDITNSILDLCHNVQ